MPWQRHSKFDGWSAIPGIVPFFRAEQLTIEQLVLLCVIPSLRSLIRTKKSMREEGEKRIEMRPYDAVALLVVLLISRGRCPRMRHQRIEGPKTQCTARKQRVQQARIHPGGRGGGFHLLLRPP
jgi:hypothetical protein